MKSRPAPPRGRIAALRLPLRGRRIHLVLPTLDQVPEMTRLLAEPSVARWTGHTPFPFRTSDGRQWVRRAAMNRRTGRAIELTIVRRTDGRILGGVGLHHIDEEGASAEVGYWIAREHRREGYASEAVDLLARTGFSRLGLHRIEARVFPSNLASRRVARRCGFRFEGRLRDEVRKDGRWHSSLLFARLATDPRAVAADRRSCERSG